VLLFFRPLIADLSTSVAQGLTTGQGAFFNQALCVGLSAFVFIVAMLLLFLELHRSGLGSLQVQQVSDGNVQVTAEAIISRLEHDILQIAQVTRVRPHVSAAKKGEVALLLEVETTPDVAVPEKMQEVISVARRAMEERMGLRLGQVQVQLDHVRAGRKQAAEAVPPNKPVGGL
jgi:uncharacterized alkaline shock family protein YloU